MARNTLGKRLEAAMATAQISAAALARQVGTTDATISNWLKDLVQPDNVKALMLLRIADAVGVSPHHLLTGEPGPLRVNDSVVAYDASQPLQHEHLTIAVQLVQEALAEAGRQVPPARFAEAARIAYELLEEGLQEAKVLRFVKTALG